MAERRITDRERRGRLITRHHLDRSAADPVEAVRGVAAMHASDPVTPYAALWSRVPGFSTEDLDRALYDERRLVRMHAMRRTLFVVPTDEAAVFAAGAARDVAARERRQLERWLAAEMDPERVPGWLAEAKEAVLAALDDGVPRRSQDLKESVAALGTEITVGSGRWTTRTAISSRLLFLMAMEGLIVRARPAGTWRSSQYHWATTDDWLASRTGALDADEARAHLLRRYLATHGPVTLEDVRWWTGWTAAATRGALDAIDVATVSLDRGGEGYVLSDDPGGEAPATPTVALLIGLDPTTMGWKERAWYLGDHATWLFDTHGNAGPTVWWDGRIVGGWAQRPDGEVVWRLLEEIGGDAEVLVEEEAGALTSWLDGVVVTPRFRTPLERALSA